MMPGIFSNLVSLGTGDRLPSRAALGRSLTHLRASRLFRNGIWAIADQALISATNFLTMVLLARSLGPASFGTFALAYAVLLFVNSVQSAVITEPHNVLGATRSGVDYARYTTAIGMAQILLVAVSALLVILGAAVATFAGWGVAPVLFVLSPAIVAWQLQEFVRRVLYTKAAVPEAFKNDLICYGGQILGIAALWRAGLLTATAALAVLAATSALGFLFGMWQIRSHLARSFSPGPSLAAIGENWRVGKWLLGTALLTWASGHLYPMMTAGFVGLAAMGAMRAMMTIMGPTHILLKAMGLLFTPRAAVVYADGHTPALRSFLGKILLATAPVMAVYCLTVALFARPLVRLLYGDLYTQYSWFLALGTLVYALTYLQTLISVAFRAMGSTAPIFRAYLRSTPVVLTLGVAAVYSLGLMGAALGMVLHGVIVNVLLYKHYRHTMKMAVAANARPPIAFGGSGPQT